jgi:hypothetical protein
MLVKIYLRKFNIENGAMYQRRNIQPLIFCVHKTYIKYRTHKYTNTYAIHILYKYPISYLTLALY